MSGVNTSLSDEIYRAPGFSTHFSHLEGAFKKSYLSVSVFSVFQAAKSGLKSQVHHKFRLTNLYLRLTFFSRLKNFQT